MRGAHEVKFTTKRGAEKSIFVHKACELREKFGPRNNWPDGFTEIPVNTADYPEFLYAYFLRYADVYEIYLHSFDYAVPQSWAEEMFFSKGKPLPPVVWSYDKEIFGEPVFFSDLLKKFGNDLAEKVWPDPVEENTALELED